MAAFFTWPFILRKSLINDVNLYVTARLGTFSFREQGGFWPKDHSYWVEYTGMYQSPEDGSKIGFWKRPALGICVCTVTREYDESWYQIMFNSWTGSSGVEFTVWYCFGVEKPIRDVALRKIGRSESNGLGICCSRVGIQSNAPGLVSCWPPGSGCKSAAKLRFENSMKTKKNSNVTGAV